MISTLGIKQQQLKNGFFTIGSGNDVMLIMGSCRVTPYVEYFRKFNEQNGNRFTIHSIDPFNFNWNENDERVDYEKALSIWEHEVGMLGMLESVKIFIHEHYQNAGMFNVFKWSEKTIYNYGMNPKVNICLPNWNDNFVLVNDILKFDSEIRKKVEQDLNVTGKISDVTKRQIKDCSDNGLQRFKQVCEKSSLPGMAAYFSNQWLYKRFFHSYNHVSKHFTLLVFELMNDIFLHLNLSKEFMNEISKEDMFDNSYTKLTQLDIDHYGMDWGEEIVPLFS